VTEGHVTLDMSTEGYAEIEEVLNRPEVRKRFPLLTAEHVTTFLEGLRGRARMISEVPAVFLYARDPDDEHILNLVLAVKAQYLVTRDKDLLDLMDESNADGVEYLKLAPDLRILDPIAFLQVVNPPPAG
jgi:putative PIN family toxin of toxin-antitoxin system